MHLKTNLILRFLSVRMLPMYGSEAAQKVLCVSCEETYAFEVIWALKGRPSGKLLKHCIGFLTS